MRAALVVVLGLLGCGGGMQRQSCYAVAEAKMVQDAERLCLSQGIAWDDCPDNARLNADLDAAYRRCP